MDGRLLLDTNVLVAIINGDPVFVALIETAEQVYVPSVVLGELYFGAFNSSRREQNVARVDSISRDRSILFCDQGTARVYGQVKHEPRCKGRPIPENDLWIAAIAAQHDLTLVSRDDHFNHIDQIRRLSG